MKRLAIIGSALGGGAGQIIEALEEQHACKPVFILDRDPNAVSQYVHDVPVIGSTDSVLKKWLAKEFDVAIVAIGGDLMERKRLFEYLQQNNVALTNVIDHSVRLGLNVRIGIGNVILNNSYLGNNVSLGDNNYILNQVSIQHDTVIESHNYLATNVTVGAKVKIGWGNRLGIKSVIETKSMVGNELEVKSCSIISKS